MFKAFCCLAAAIALLGAAPATYATHYDVRRFHDCYAASFYAADHPQVGLYQYQFQARFEQTSVTHDPALGYRASAHIVYTLAPGRSIVFLPLWSWPNMTPGQRRDLRDFVAALRNHELGHVEIAVRGIAGRSSTITVLSSTPAKAKAMLAASVSNQLHTLYSEVLANEKAYDRITGHGTHQSDGPSYGYRGGENVVFGCR